ncbi:MAG: hypothetical protein WC223_06090 [Bacteroidales bacterium]|jgi:REP element-mobilizing transposase RayT
MKQDVFETGVVYHIFNRGNNKEDIFREDRNYYYFLSLVKKYLLSISDIYAYCLLKNHFHILLRIKDNNELSEKLQAKPFLAFSNLFNTYTKSINKAYNRTGSLFQEHLQRNRVKDESYLIKLIAYIHLNPLKHQFTNDFRNYPFSSYKAYTTNKKTDIKKDFIMEIFGNVENFEYWHNLKKISYEGIIEEIENMDN